jgi:hypothetical protein
MILSFDKPKKVLPTKEHNKRYSSDSGVAGTYVPNMSTEDMLKWKAKQIGGDDPRIEIRKTVKGIDPAFAGRFNRGHCSAQMVLIVRPKSVIFSSNGRAVLSNDTWLELQQAVKEAQLILFAETKKKKGYAQLIIMG